MSISNVISHSDCDVMKLQSESLSEAEGVLFESEKYHAAGIVRDGKLMFSSYEENDSESLLSLAKDHLKIKFIYPPFVDSTFHVYFADTDYPILYRQVDTVLHFFLPGSGTNYYKQEYLNNFEVISRIESNYFGNLLNYAKPLNEIFRNFQFNSIDCGQIKKIQMNGGSLGGGVQHFLLVYILQNVHMFSALNNIVLDIEVPSCFHAKIITSLSGQFNDALLLTKNPLEISINYIMHLKDSTSRRGSPFALEYTCESDIHNVVYGIELYAYCNEEECHHTMKNLPSNKYACDIMPAGQVRKKYHTCKKILRRHAPYCQFKTSNFQEIQNLRDKFILHQNHFDAFQKFFFNVYGDNCLAYFDAHICIFRHEKLADEMLKKYKSHTTCQDNEESHLYRKISCLEEIDSLCRLKNLAKKNAPVTREHTKWNSQYLELCSAKSELAKLLSSKSTD